MSVGGGSAQSLSKLSVLVLLVLPLLLDLKRVGMGSESSMLVSFFLLLLWPGPGCGFRHSLIPYILDTRGLSDQHAQQVKKPQLATIAQVFKTSLDLTIMFR
mmetsp:Transcript_2455/g.4471  ORF Transcript_2455/g.4471 Transcript_2455/m.4471 type:complete len:102 (-) Transcript_2455:9-314(-)